MSILLFITFPILFIGKYKNIFKVLQLGQSHRKFPSATIFSFLIPYFLFIFLAFDEIAKHQDINNHTAR